MESTVNAYGNTMLKKLSILSLATIASLTLNQEFANAITADGGSTGWNPVSTNSEQSCAKKAVQEMNFFVNSGKIQNTPRSGSRFKNGNNAVFNIVCSKKGDYVRVDVICINGCSKQTYRLRKAIDQLITW